MLITLKMHFKVVLEETFKKMIIENLFYLQYCLQSHHKLTFRIVKK